MSDAADDEGRVSLELSGYAVTRGASASAETAEALLRRFTGGSIDVGQRLPSERTLAAELRVGRSAIREALAALEILGIVEVRPGSGAYLRNTSSELLPKTLAWGLLLAGDRTDELMGIREQLEIYAARLAALHRTNAEAEALHECVAQQRTRDVDQFIAADIRFHAILADATHNETLAMLLSTMRAILRIYMERKVRRSGEIVAARREHEAVAKAIAAQDPEAAAAAMDLHMVTATRRISAAFDTH